VEKIKVEGPGRRCPYCHDAVEEVVERAACQQCLAVHHVGCWRELGRCGACAHEQALLPAGASGALSATPRARGPRVAPDLAGREWLSYDDAQRVLEITRVELLWLLENQHLAAQPLGAVEEVDGQALPGKEVFALRPRIEALMNERQAEEAVDGERARLAVGFVFVAVLLVSFMTMALLKAQGAF